MSRAVEKMAEHVKSCEKCKAAKTLAERCTTGYVLQRVIDSESNR